MFQPVESSVAFPKLEEEISRFWRERAIYEKSLAARANAPNGPFIFYEGPPTANGLPHPGHCLTRSIKDLFPRYKTMRGYLCRRKAGWDTHGLPVEVEVCKELGIHSKEEIEAYGVEPFIRKCVESVFRYTHQWEQLTQRLGFWIHLDEAYVTFHRSYVESVWWALKTLFDRGLLYQGHKIVWWWAQGGTALSAGEVGQGYREVADPSVFVRFPIVVDDKAKSLGLDENASLLVWTTTPWTLPANQFAAVKPDIEYSLIVDPTDANKKLIVAKSLASTIIEKVQRSRGEVDLGKQAVLGGPAIAFAPVKTFKGEQLVGLRYVPPFDDLYRKPECWGEFIWNLKPSQGVPILRSKSGQASADDLRTNRGFAESEEAIKAHGIEEFNANGECSWLRAWRVCPASFVTTDTGTGIVHIAPAFGEDDFNLLQTIQVPTDIPVYYQPKLLCPVAPDGKFTDDVPAYRGRWVKDCDKDIIRQLKAEGKLFHQEQYLHDYPFCWRAEEDPLIQYPRKSWFIKTTAFKEKMLANNSHINWLPEHIKDGRFGNFLETNVDWALSRERYWGTPLPIWVCEKTGNKEAIGNYDELLKKPGVTGMERWTKAKLENPDLPDDLCVHKPYIDAVTYDSPWAPGARMRRVSEVIDCWFDSGAMPFAQWGYPNAPGSAEQFQSQFPADFISEAIDQTRGWFYSLLAISTLLFGEGAGDGGRGTGEARLAVSQSFPHPFRNCIVLGLMLGEDGQKMSKSKRNYREPTEIFDRYGADALRWYFFANQPPWTSIRYSEQSIKDCIPEFLLRLWNVYSFFVIYAKIDGFDPASAIRSSGVVPGQLGSDVISKAKGYRPVAKRCELDRWILSELNRTAAAVVERMDAYDNFNACARLTEFVDALSNWYVRSSRDRFWSSGTVDQSPDKNDAYWTLYECLLTTCKLTAPFVPFLSEAMWQNLAVAAFDNSSTKKPVESVHLCDYPAGDRSVIDETLSEQMALAREIVSLGRSARMGAKLKVRQPLSLVEVVLADATHQTWLEEHASLICDELNVKRVEFTQKADQYITYSVLPDLKKLGPKLGKRLPALRKLLATSDGGKLLAEMQAKGNITLALPDGPIALDADDIQVRLQAKEGWAAAQGRAIVVVLATDLTDALIREGLARELVRTVQDRRKELGCEFTDRISIGLVTEAPELKAAIEQFSDYIRGETLAVELSFAPLAGVEPLATDVADYAATLYVKVA